jgi:hypothetical protein
VPIDGMLGQVNSCEAAAEYSKMNIYLQIILQMQLNF